MTTRKTIIEAIAKHGQLTYDDIERITGISRDKARIAVDDAKKVNHVAMKKDDVTGQPSYKITSEGKDWLANYGKAVVKKSAAPSLSMPVSARAPADIHQGIKKSPEIAVDRSNKADSLREQLRAAEESLSQFKKLESDLAAWKQVGASVGADTPDTLRAHLVFQDASLVEATRRANDAQDKLADIEAKASHARIPSGIITSDDQLLAALDAPDPVGFVVASPNEPLRRFKKHETAQASALSVARRLGLAEVFAIYPHGKAVRGVEWKKLA